MKKAGADRVGIAIDAATPELFDQLRGKGVGGPHRWDHYWECRSMGSGGLREILCRNPSHRRSGRNREGDGRNDSEEARTWEPIPISSPSSLRREAPWKDILCLLSISTEEFSSARWIINEGLGPSSQMRFDEHGKTGRFWDGYPASHRRRERPL